MKPPRIDWNFKHIPANNEEVEAAGGIQIDGEVLFMVLLPNRKPPEMVFVWGENYGKLISGGEDA